MSQDDRDGIVGRMRQTLASHDKLNRQGLRIGAAHYAVMLVGQVRELLAEVDGAEPEPAEPLGSTVPGVDGSHLPDEGVI